MEVYDEIVCLTDPKQLHPKRKGKKPRTSPGRLRAQGFEVKRSTDHEWSSVIPVTRENPPIPFTENKYPQIQQNLLLQNIPHASNLVQG